MEKGNLIKYFLALLGIIIVFVAGGFFAYRFGRTLRNAGQLQNSTTLSTISSSYNSPTSSTIPLRIAGTTTILPTTIPYNATITTRTTTIYYQSYCYANAGFECGYADYSGGNLSLEIVQDTNASWNDVYVAFSENISSGNNSQNVSFMTPDAVHIRYMYSGYGYDVILPIGSPNTAIGTAMHGYIWVKYTYLNSTHYAELGAVNLTSSYMSKPASVCTTTSTVSTSSTTISSTTI